MSFQRIRELGNSQLLLLQRLLQIDLSYVIRNGASLFITALNSIVLGVATYFLYSRYLSQEVFGVYKYALSIYALFSIVSLTGIDTALARSVARGHDGALEVAFIRKLKAGYIGSVGLVALAGWYFYRGDAVLWKSMLLMAVFAPLIYAASIYGSFLTSKKLFHEYRNIAITTSIGIFVIIGTAVVLGVTTVQLIAAYLVANMLVCVAYLRAKRFKANQRTDIEMVRYGNHLSIVEVFGTAASQVDSLLTFHFLGAAPLAVYGIANLPVDQLRGFLKISQSLAFPKFTQYEKRHVRQLFWKVMLLTAGTMVCCTVYTLCIPTVIRVFVPRYVDSILYTQVLVFSLVFSVPTGFIASYFYAQAAKKEIVIYNITNSASLIVLNSVGILLFGLWGIVAASWINRVLMFIVTMWGVVRYSRTST